MTIKNIMIGAGVSLLALSSALHADQSGFTLGADIGSLGLADAGTDTGLGGRLGYQFEGPLAVELANLNLDGEFDALSLDVLYNFVENQDVAVFASLGGGEYDIANIEEDFVALGIGFKGFLTDNLAIRTGVKAIDADSATRDGTDFMTTVGLEGIFGSYGKGASAEKAPARSKPVAAAAAPLDSDKDGVFDSADQCPTTAAGVSVDARGCELDSDYDGVVDSKDNCNDTKVGAKVDANGCYIILKEAKQVELKVNFPTNSNEVGPEYFAEIEQVATFMREYPNTSVVVEGHTDSRGAAEYNKSLSQKRAAMIASILVERYNVEQSRVSAQGYGEERPIASNETAEGRAANRRVVAVIKTVVEKVAE